jgi:hypothetical protein
MAAKKFGKPKQKVKGRAATKTGVYDLQYEHVCSVSTLVWRPNIMPKIITNHFCASACPVAR